MAKERNANLPFNQLAPLPPTYPAMPHLTPAIETQGEINSAEFSTIVEESSFSYIRQTILDEDTKIGECSLC